MKNIINKFKEKRIKKEIKSLEKEGFSAHAALLAEKNGYIGNAIKLYQKAKLRHENFDNNIYAAKLAFDNGAIQKGIQILLTCAETETDFFRKRNYFFYTINLMYYNGEKERAKKIIKNSYGAKDIRYVGEGGFRFQDFPFKPDLLSEDMRIIRKRIKTI